MTIKYVEIHNFRGIKNLTLENLGNINIFTGRNNVGKSTCLEAIALLSSGDNQFFDVLEKDIIDQILFQHSNSNLSWDYITNVKSDSATLNSYELDSNGTKTSSHVFIAKGSENLKSSPEEGAIKLLHEKFLQNRIVSDNKKLTDTTNQLHLYYKNEIECLTGVYRLRHLESPIRVNITNPQNHKSSKKILYLTKFDGLEVLLHDIAIKNKVLHKSLKKIIEKIPHFRDLRKVKDHLQVFFDGGIDMPFFTMGDGLKAVIISTLATHTLENGILIMEEPENYLHPGLMQYLADEFVHASNNFNTQIFISSHSDEFIKFILETKEKIDISVIQLTIFNNDIEAQIMKQDSAYEKLEELGMDLRGI